MKKITAKLFLLSGVFVGLLTLVCANIACISNSTKNDIDFDLQAGKIVKPSGVWSN
jgi:uncharacterized oligopeptide transporter (OPT) family protein